MTTGYNNMGGATGMAAYHEASAQRCPLNGTCDCCTCRCCGLCILIIWVIFGGWGAISYLNLASDLTSYSVCPPNTGDIEGECCEFDMNGSSFVIDGSCDGFKSFAEITAANGILQCIAGVVGCVGMFMYIAWLLIIPAGWAILSVVLSIVGLALVGFGAFAFLAIPSMGIALLIAILFYSNYKIMKETDPKSG